MSLPTEGEVFAQLIEFLRKAQESTAMLSHLSGANDRKTASKGWLVVSEQLKAMQRVVTQIATGKLN